MKFRIIGVSFKREEFKRTNNADIRKNKKKIKTFHDEIIKL